MTIFIFLVFTWFDWQVIKTENFTIIYKPGYEWEAYQSLKNLEYYRKNVVALTGNDTRNLPVVIEDIGTSSNGFANPIFYNIHFFIYPPGSGSYLEGIEDWYRILSVHEFTHIAHMTKTNTISRYLTGLFGSPFQSNMYAPGWIIEGITVYSESKNSIYEGRLNDGYFDSYMGARISEGKFPSIIEATNEPLSFPNGKIYLYGGEFFNFLAQKYGEEKFRNFFKTYGSYPWAPVSAIFPGLGLDIAVKRIYGKSFPELFKEWKKYEDTRFSKFQAEGDKITNKGWYISSLVADNDKLFFIRESSIKLNAFEYKNLWRIIELNLNTHKEKIIATLNSQITTKIKIYNNQLYFSTAELKHAPNIYYNGYGITSTLRRFNLMGKNEQVLFTDDIRTFCILDDDVIIYVTHRQHDFGSEIWLYTPENKKKLWEGSLLINEIETNGKWIVVSASQQFENPDLYTFDPETGNFSLIQSTPWTEGHLCFMQTDWLGFIANFEGKHRIYAIKLITPDSILCYKKNGFVNSFAFSENTLYFSSLNANGFDIYKKISQPENYTLPDWQLNPKPDFNSQRIEEKKGSYLDIAKTLFPSARLPLFLPMDATYKKWLYGAIFSGSDATDENFYLTYLGYDQLNNKLFLKSNLQSLFFSPVQIELFYNYNDYLKISSSYPVFNILRPGISHILLNLNLKSYDEYRRKEISPVFMITWRRPYYTGYWSFSAPFERKSLKSLIDRTCLTSGIGLNYVLFTGEFHTRMAGFSDPQNPDAPHISIRGYAPIYSHKGILFRTEYSHQLLKLRKGLWNPNIYFEDLFGIIFFDCAIDQNREKYYSLGLEIALESKACFGFIQIIPNAGLAINRDKRIKLFIELTATPSELP